ncbi:DUF6161 domain-containing protein [Rufibacter soli]
MTNSEVKSAISNAINIEWHKEIEETFNYSYIDLAQSFIGVSAIYEYTNQQIKGWKSIKEDLPSELSASLIYFENVKNAIIHFIQNYTKSQDSNLLHYWSSVRNTINNTSSYPLPYNAPQTYFLLTTYKESPKYYNGAFNFVTNSNPATHSKELFFGAILAYEYSLKDRTEITGRRKTEQKSLNNLKADFQEYLSASEKEIIDHLRKTNKDFEDHAKQIDDLKATKEKDFNEWFENTKDSEWKSWYDEKVIKLQKLEETYEAKLKLEKPAKYWQIKSNLYYQQGNAAKRNLFWIIGLTGVLLSSILLISPNWIFTNVFQGNSIAIVRWSLIFVTLLTLIAFTVKAVTKYMFSSYHLARDAEERHTLTFFYLALIKDTDVKDDDRKLILQSLFSRVETGLLKDDSSPTMPNDLISKLFQK